MTHSPPSSPKNHNQVGGEIQRLDVSHTVSDSIGTHE